ncbi:MAG: DUF2637 domain-containing protein [Anaerolineales bacterium]|nr:DUF2637 domain-containing protein [Anaerolineales bacterium]
MPEPLDFTYDPLVARLDKWSNWLLVIVVLIPFIVSFGALKELAAENGVNYPFMYPLMIDLSLIIFNLIALRSSLYGERNLYALTLVVVATVISVVLNTVHAPREPLPMFMAALPPLFILAAFHLVVVRIEQSAKYGRATLTLEKLNRMIAAAKAKHEQLTAQNKAVTREINAQNEQLEIAKRELKQAQRERSQLEQEQSLDDAITARRERLQALLNDPATTMTQVELAQALGVSISTVRRDLQSLNGQAAG